jgi:hypothetical protein
MAEGVTYPGVDGEGHDPVLLPPKHVLRHQRGHLPLLVHAVHLEGILHARLGGPACARGGWGERG